MSSVYGVGCINHWIERNLYAVKSMQFVFVEQIQTDSV